MIYTKYFVFLQNFVFILRFKESKDTRRNIYSNFLYDYTIVIKCKDIIYKLCCSDYRFKIQTYVCFEI